MFVVGSECQKFLEQKSIKIEAHKYKTNNEKTSKYSNKRTVNVYFDKRARALW